MALRPNEETLEHPIGCPRFGVRGGAPACANPETGDGHTRAGGAPGTHPEAFERERPVAPEPGVGRSTTRGPLGRAVVGPVSWSGDRCATNDRGKQRMRERAYAIESTLKTFMDRNYAFTRTWHWWTKMELFPQGRSPPCISALAPILVEVLRDFIQSPAAARGAGRGL